MLLGYCAFRQMHRDSYLRYARVRVGDRGTAVVGDVFDSLGCRWPEVLRSACPAAFSWRLLSRCVSEADRATGAADEGLEGLYGALPAEQADAVLLHYRLGMTLTAGADLMGIGSSVMAAHLLMAERSLPRWLSTVLRPPEAGTLWGRR
ncbi:hypothetical protein [Streptomyces cucumeris]|uniref:hypothetical protein n=1 Tax=Streptomyces cucumeris TaxID=2962890 RepID=UPI0020C8DF3C|nr:hypothetical protein [Streptomyces sp. NEAU-Y11]MCP9211470.1 hypothetical protein [Streptomyces sp. NEAU-Y11]